MSRDPDARFTAGRIVSAWAGEAILNDGGDDRSIGALAKRAAMPSRTREPEITAALKTTAGLPADPEIRENGREDRRAAAALGAEMTREGCPQDELPRSGKRRRPEPFVFNQPFSHFSERFEVLKNTS